MKITQYKYLRSFFNLNKHVITSGTYYDGVYQLSGGETVRLYKEEGKDGRPAFTNMYFQWGDYHFQHYWEGNLTDRQLMLYCRKFITECKDILDQMPQ